MKKTNNNNNEPKIILQSFDKGFVIKVKYNISEKDMEGLYNNLYKQLQRGLIILNEGLELVETFKIDYMERRIY